MCKILAVVIHYQRRARLRASRSQRVAHLHYNDVIITTMASQNTSLTIAYSAVYSGADQRKHQCSSSLAFVRGIHRGPVNSPRKGTVPRKMFPFDDVIMWVLSSRGGPHIDPMNLAMWSAMVTGPLRSANMQLGRL